MRKYVIFVILVVFSFISIPKLNAMATTFGELLDELDDLYAQKAEQENEKAMTEAEYNRVSNEIVISQQKLDQYSADIIEANNKIAQFEEDIAKKKKETDSILVFLELSNGEKSYLEYIFKATSFTDFIHRISIVEELSRYNDDLIKEMNDLIKQNEELKIERENNIKAEEAERENLQANLRSLGSKIADLISEGPKIDEEIAGVEETIEFYRNLGAENRNDVLAYFTPIPPATGFLRPLTSGIVTDWYGPRWHPVTGAYQSTHSGIDISDGGWPVGKEIYPVAAGKVAFKTTWSCGGNVLGIWHNVKGVEYTSIYMHLQGFNVEVGDAVDTNDVIAYMGGIYDSCSTGPHLHLTMTSGHLTSAGSYSYYMFDPAEVIYFPDGWFYERSWW